MKFAASGYLLSFAALVLTVDGFIDLGERYRADDDHHEGGGEKEVGRASCRERV